MKWWRRSSKEPRVEAIELLSELIGELRAMDFSRTMTTDGWREASRENWVGQFSALKERLIAGETDEYLTSHLVRLLDHDGISEGSAQRLAARVQEDLIAISASNG